MKALIITALLAATIVGLYLTFTQNQTPVSQQMYNLYKIQFGKNYGVEENKYRFQIFKEFIKTMRDHNIKQKSWKMGLNQFSDISQQEFLKNYLGQNAPLPNKDYDKSITVGATDWVAAGAITAIRNQGSCGSCWAFASSAVHESYQILKNKEDISIHLSPQQLVDCSTDSPYGNHGCNGGLAKHGLQYIRDYGQTTEQSYPYKASNQRCSQSTGVYKIKGVEQVSGCTNLQNMLTNTPLAVRVDASNWSKYKSGIFNSCQQSHNHAVLLVGSTDNYWTIKNSWGASWGEKGFIRLAKGNTCGVCYGPSYPL